MTDRQYADNMAERERSVVTEGREGGTSGITSLSDSDPEFEKSMVLGSIRDTDTLNCKTVDQDSSDSESLSDALIMKSACLSDSERE